MQRQLKPQPYKWTITQHGIVEHYDFQYYKKPNPPPIDHNPVVIRLYRGEYKNGCWISL